MIITLKGANFADSNIGTLSTWTISRVLGDGATYDGVTYVDKNAAFNATVTIAEGYEIGAAGVTVTMGGVGQAYTVVENVVTINIAEVTGNVVIKVPTKNTATGEEGGGGSEPETPVNPPVSSFTAVPYTSQLSASGLSKTDGSILSSGTGYVNVYENLDFNKTYYASGYAPVATGNNACVCYYKADGTFISSESGSDWGVSSEKYEHKQLTIPEDTATIKLFGRTNSGEGCTLEIGANYILISHSEINEKSNLTKSDGTLGTSTTGVVKTYNNINTSKIYIADGFCPNATGQAAFVCYYDSSNAFIGHQDGSDFGLSSKAASKVTLTVPSGTSTIKLFGQSGSSDPYLYTIE